MKSFLTRHQNKIYKQLTSPYSLVIILLLLCAWGIVGIYMDFDATWYKVLHLSQLLITFLMVFIVQHMKSVDTRAIQEKLDEIIKKMPEASNKKVGLEKKMKGEIE